MRLSASGAEKECFLRFESLGFRASANRVVQICLSISKYVIVKVASPGPFQSGQGSHELHRVEVDSHGRAMRLEAIIPEHSE